MNGKQIEDAKVAKSGRWVGQAIALLAAICGVVGGVALWLPSAQYEANYSTIAEQSVQRETNAALQKIASECDTAETGRENCKVRIWADTERVQREIGNLQVQRTMAVWTRAIGISAIAGMAVGIGTLGLIFLTLRATQRAAEYSGVAAEQARLSLSQIEKATATQLRPYIAITENDEGKGEPFNRRSKVVFIVKNFGQIPANNVRLSFGDMFVTEPIGNIEIPLDDKFGDYGLLAPGDFRTERVGAENIRLEEIADMIARDLKLLLRIRIDYEWPGGTDFHDMTVILDDPSESRWAIVDERRRVQGKMT